MRIAVTELDAGRAYRASRDPDAFEQLVARLRYRSKPTPRMLAGRAFHKALEHAVPGTVTDELEADGYRFLIMPGVDLTLDLPPVRELRMTARYVVDGIDVTLVGVVDALLGLRVDDHKFVGSFNAERHVETYQWRAYLDMLDADRFRWNAFTNAPTEDDDCWIVTGLQKLECTRYPGMSADVQREVEWLARFIRQHVPERRFPTYRKRTV